ncbi:hypothetical protein K8R47_01800, partial [archaeon]|nr:hypothetical protein [archaeon]
RDNGRTYCKLLYKEIDENEIPRRTNIGNECSACPTVFRGVGSCTGKAYGSIWFGHGPYQDEIAQKCPGYNQPIMEENKLRVFQEETKERCKEWLRDHYNKEGIERVVI